MRSGVLKDSSSAYWYIQCCKFNQNLSSSISRVVVIMRHVISPVIVRLIETNYLKYFSFSVCEYTQKCAHTNVYVHMHVKYIFSKEWIKRASFFICSLAFLSLKHYLNKLIFILFIVILYLKLFIFAYI